MAAMAGIDVLRPIRNSRNFGNHPNKKKKKKKKKKKMMMMKKKIV